MKSLRLIFILATFFIIFCFKNLDLPDIHSSHFDFSLLTLFVTVTFFGPILPV